MPTAGDDKAILAAAKADPDAQPLSARQLKAVVPMRALSGRPKLRGSAFAFAAEVERQIESLSLDDFHRRQGHSKLLLEEWYPISRLGLHLKQPGLDVTVEAFGNSGVADGRIEERGFRTRAFDVQVTYVDDYQGAMRRELMRQQGFAPGAGPISRNKATGGIEAAVAAVDMDHHLTSAASGIVERFTKKAAKTYPLGTALLVAFDDMTMRGRSDWSSLLRLVDSQVDLAASGFESVYILNCATNELVKAG
jgi:hypothetical protein